MDQMVNKTLYGGYFNGRKVFVTGHTGFKGSWLSLMLKWLGADVYGYALKPHTTPSLYELAGIDHLVSSTIGDIRDYQLLHKTLQEVQPEVIIHMAAQAIVRESYRNPRETYEINVMGTVNLFDSARQLKSVKGILNVTTDKCYENREWHWGYRENEPMGGFDPYSSSKGCSELVTAAYRNSFFNLQHYNEHGIALASARAGNVIGGGDWAVDRLVPDIIRSIIKGEKVIIRSPYAIRPWQHVIEPLSGYLTLCERLANEGIEFAQAWNFGPDDKDAKNVEWITSKLCDYWGKSASYEIDKSPQPHEASYLKLDCSKARSELGWSPKWDINTALEMIIEWTKSYVNESDLHHKCISQIEKYFLKGFKINNELV